MQKSDSIKEIATALAKFQGIVTQPKKDTPVSIKYQDRSGKWHEKGYKYATLDGLIAAIKEPMQACGLSYIQDVHTNGTVEVSTLLMHVSGEWIQSSAVTFPAGAGKAQDVASLITYGRRYSLSATLGIASEPDDDGEAGQAAQDQAPPPMDQQHPGNADQEEFPDTAPSRPTTPKMGGNGFISEAQAKRIFALAKGNTDRVKAVLTNYGYEKSTDIRKADYDAICLAVKPTES